MVQYAGSRRAFCNLSIIISFTGNEKLEKNGIINIKYKVEYEKTFCNQYWTPNR